MNTTRRKFLKTSAITGAVVAGIGAGILAPRNAMAAWPKAAFDATDVNTAIGSSDMIESNDIEVKAPDIAENGAVVPISITSKIAGTETISILLPGNNTPLAASFQLSGRTEGFVSTRVKMGKTSHVIAVVKANGKLYTAKKEVKVTIGGCGG
ncbi:MAG TPA: thiosulfate oxidation carrier protein SoxY [Gammaproteobacteria bacterium]|nr:thiosulfate oxidation carrier protein SoxY [Gammaproteobacteria bacterium]